MRENNYCKGKGKVQSDTREIKYFCSLIAGRILKYFIHLRGERNTYSLQQRNFTNSVFSK